MILRFRVKGIRNRSFNSGALALSHSPSDSVSLLHNEYVESWGPDAIIIKGKRFTLSRKQNL